ncbi:TetR/AcrR family transcriptional regulator [Sorangium cellulosum]|uniref:TetR family transcriptional regulator n=1 Tax=Sorangium cellulosum TaxID=56 RepID=A0A150Q546_SORCE|nr:TetR/AcrR family transcriptional regulator [Sorangium cellulosum]KYF63105.1 TetR family transcriptional regulator [Sorangium cellulosum]
MVEEALALIEERGNAGFTLREVARRIGVSHAAPYRHFPDKRALMAELAVQASTALAAQISAALEAAGGAGGDLRARFLAAGFAYVRFALEHPAPFHVMYSGEVDPEDPRVAAATSRSLGLLLGFIEEAQRAGAFPPGEPMALAVPIWAMHHGVATLAASGALSKAGPAELRRVSDDAHARLLDGLLLAAPGPPRA